MHGGKRKIEWDEQKRKQEKLLGGKSSIYESVGQI
jgi:hypothetical protein